MRAARITAGMVKPKKNIVPVDEAAAILGCNPATVRRKLQRHDLLAYYLRRDGCVSEILAVDLDEARELGVMEVGRRVKKGEA